MFVELNFWNIGSMVSVASVPLAVWYGVRVLVGIKDFSLFQNNQTGSGAHPALCWGVLSLYWSLF
jgi:hypothetical protein